MVSETKCWNFCFSLLAAHQPHVAIQEANINSTIAVSELFPDTCMHSVYRNDRNTHGGGVCKLQIHITKPRGTYMKPSFLDTVSCFSILSFTTWRKHAYIFDSLTPHFYIVKLGVYRGIQFFFLFLLETPQSMFLNRNMKKFSFWKWSFLYIWIGVFS